MFGASVALDFSIDGGVVGATVKGQAGFDVAMVDASSARCQGRPIGLDGWYGQGQIYGYITADGWVGMSESVTEWINAGFKWVEDVGCTIASWFGGCKKTKQAQYKAVVRVRPVRYSIAKVYAGATFQAGMPNPTWYAGTVELKYTVAGITNSTRQNFTEGTRCTP